MEKYTLGSIYTARSIYTFVHLQISVHIPLRPSVYMFLKSIAAIIHFLALLTPHNPTLETFRECAKNLGGEGRICPFFHFYFLWLVSLQHAGLYGSVTRRGCFLLNPILSLLLMGGQCWTQSSTINIMTAHGFVEGFNQ